MRDQPWPAYAGAIAAAVLYAAARNGDLGRTVRTICRAVVALLLSAFRVPTPDIVSRLAAISDDGTPPVLGTEYPDQATAAREQAGRTGWRVIAVHEEVRPPPRPRRRRPRRRR